MFTNKQVVNIYNVYERNLPPFTVGKGLCKDVLTVLKYANSKQKILKQLLDYMDMSLIFQLIMIVLMLMIF